MIQLISSSNPPKHKTNTKNNNPIREWECRRSTPRDANPIIPNPFIPIQKTIILFFKSNFKKKNRLLVKWAVKKSTHDFFFIINKKIILNLLMNMKFICVIGYMPKIQNLYEKKNTNPFLQYSWSAKINTICGHSWRENFSKWAICERATNLVKAQNE